MYFNGTMHGWNDHKGYHPPKRTTAVYCDGCAETEIPLPPETTDNRGRRHWDSGFKWAPHYGGFCTKCGRPG